MDSVKDGFGVLRKGTVVRGWAVKAGNGLGGMDWQGSLGEVRRRTARKARRVEVWTGSRGAVMRDGAWRGVVRQSRQEKGGKNVSAFESKYSWKKGYQYKVSADTVGGVLNRIEKEEGKVTKESFLEYSRNENSETHEMFEWDDSVAAEKYRLRQAGQIISQLEVTIVREDVQPREIEAEIEFNDEPTNISAFVNIAPKAPAAPATYYNINRAMSDESTRKQVIRNALFELQAFKRKYRNLTEFAELFEAIEKVTNEQIIT